MRNSLAVAALCLSAAPAFAHVSRDLYEFLFRFAKQ